jgi:hypothetical protein
MYPLPPPPVFAQSIHRRLVRGVLLVRSKKHSGGWNDLRLEGCILI